MPPRICVLDLETRLGPDDKKFAHLTHDEQWDALRRGEGGVSALVIWDSVENWPYLYDDTSLRDAAARLEAADIVVGYHSKGFDIPIIENLLDRRLALREHVDPLTDIWAAIRSRDSMERLRGYKLEDLAQRCLGRYKAEKSAHAPRLAAEGQWARLFHYCMDDVRLTRDVVIYILNHGGVIDASGHFLSLSLPDSLRAIA